MCLVCDIPPTLGRSREASLGWDGPEERGGDTPLILPGTGVVKAIPVLRGPRGRKAFRTRAARGSIWRSLRTSRQELADRH